jgi:hypothetical protein
MIPAFGDRLTMEMSIVLSVPLNGKTCDTALEGQGYELVLSAPPGRRSYTNRCISMEDVVASPSRVNGITAAWIGAEAR